MGLQQTKKLFHSQGIINKLKRKPIKWKNIFINDISLRGLTKNIQITHIIQYQGEKKRTYLKNGQRTWIDIFSKKTHRWLTDTWRDAQHHQASRKYKSKLQWDNTSHLSEWLFPKEQKITSAAKSAEQMEPSCTVDTCVNWCSHYEKQYGNFPKIKNRAVIWSSNFTSGYLAEENKTTNLKGYMHSCIYCSIIYDSQDMREI